MFVEAIFHKPALKILGAICQASLATGYPLIIAFAVGKEPGFGSESVNNFKHETHPPLRYLFIDSTIVRAHQHASGALKKSGGKAKQAIGRSSGGLTTKLHTACADERVAVSLCLSAGQSHDATAFPSVWEGAPKSRWLDAAVMD